MIFARHGESEYSALGLMNGDVSVPVGLTGRGVREARELGATLAGEPVDLCVTSSMQRAIETADAALADRRVARLEMPELNDPLYGPFEGRPLEEYRAWATARPSSARPEPGGESRLMVVLRYARGLRLLLGRPEESILVVCHSLPVAYALAAREGRTPTAHVSLVGHATAHPFTRDEVEAAASLLEAWVADPTW